jgi:hypothetical protein
MIILDQAVNLQGAHIAGLPVEETLVSLGPVLLVAGGAAVITLRARLRRAHDARPQRNRGDSRDVLGAVGDDPAIRRTR